MRRTLLVAHFLCQVSPSADIFTFFTLVLFLLLTTAFNGSSMLQPCFSWHQRYLPGTFRFSAYSSSMKKKYLVPWSTDYQNPWIIFLLVVNAHPSQASVTMFQRFCECIFQELEKEIVILFIPINKNLNVLHNHTFVSVLHYSLNLSKISEEL